MRVGVLYSGGKDSNLALYKAYLQGYEIACLITILPENDESMLFHYPNSSYTREQAECLGLPLISRHADHHADEEGLLKEVLILAKDRFAIDGVVSGAVASRYQHSRFTRIAESAGLRHIAPCYGEDQMLHMQELFEHRVTAIITSVSADGLDATMLGRCIDHAMVSRLSELSARYGFNVSFEGGEAETFVLDMPIFSRRILVDDYAVHWDGVRGYMEFRAVRLMEKMREADISSINRPI